MRRQLSPEEQEGVIMAFRFDEHEYHRIHRKPRRLRTRTEQLWLLAARIYLTRGLPAVPTTPEKES